MGKEAEYEGYIASMLAERAALSHLTPQPVCGEVLYFAAKPGGVTCALPANHVGLHYVDPTKRLPYIDITVPMRAARASGFLEGLFLGAILAALFGMIIYVIRFAVS